LGALGFRVVETAPGLLTVTVPGWRATKDISLKDDLVEEIGRMVGYDEISPVPPMVACVPPPANPLRDYLRQFRSQMAAQGFTEAYNYSFVNDDEAKLFSLDVADHIAVRNPIASEQTHLRRSLLPGLFGNLVSNVRHSQEFRIFEVGSEIHPSARPDLPRESVHAAALLYSAHADEQDFFELKRVVECVLPGGRLRASEARAYEHPARTAEIRIQDTVLGRIFEVHPSLLRAESIEGRAVVFDIDVDEAMKIAFRRAVKYAPVRKYPTSGFDLSVVATLEKPVANIEAQLKELGAPDLALIDFVRQYAGPPLPEGHKSVSYHLEVGALDHTLTADEVTDIRNRIIDGMRQRGYELRV
ncbi:MAG: hypothetical protein JO061_21735, partial [Acidobacteriaceae bacterium]|nr:hypothetical protein [Acidobacteriaceae bacterium]